MGKASTKSKNKYNSKVYDQISIKPKKGTKEEWQTEAERHEETLTEYIINAVKMRMAADRKREDDKLLEDFYNQNISVLEKSSSSDLRKLICSGGKQLKNYFQIESLYDVKLFLESCIDINDIYNKLILDYEQREEIDIFIRAYNINRQKTLEEAKRKLDNTSVNK